jgi:dihydroneopterin aldolase
METLRLTGQTRVARQMFVRDLVLAASIGVYPHEHAVPQRVRINLDLAIADDDPAQLSRAPVGRDELARVVDYEELVVRVRQLVAAGHVQLVETLAERIAEACLTDRRVLNARVRVEKLDVFADAAAVGVEIERGGC